MPIYNKLIGGQMNFKKIQFFVNSKAKVWAAYSLGRPWIKLAHIFSLTHWIGLGQVNQFDTSISLFDRKFDSSIVVEV
jgi:hypothetical protein